MEVLSIAVQCAAMKTPLSAQANQIGSRAQIARRIYAARESLRLSKAEFADSIEFDRSTLSKVEKADAGLDIAVAIRIATLYGIGLDFIYRGQLDDVPIALRPAVLSNMHAYDVVFGRVDPT